MNRPSPKKADINHTCMLAWGMMPAAQSIEAQRNQLKPIRAELKRHYMRLIVHDLWWPAYRRDGMPDKRWRLIYPKRYQNRPAKQRVLCEGTLQECCLAAVRIILRPAGHEMTVISHDEAITLGGNDAVPQD